MAVGYEEIFIEEAPWGAQNITFYMELFYRRRKRLVSAQLSKKFSYFLLETYMLLAGVRVHEHW